MSTLPHGRVSASGVVDRFGGGFEMFNTAADERHVSACFRQRTRHTARDSGTAACHESNVVF